jgi:hypothetical protein
MSGGDGVAPSYFTPVDGEQASGRVRSPPLRPADAMTGLPGGPQLKPHYADWQQRVRPLLPQSPVVRGGKGPIVNAFKFGKQLGKWGPFAYVGGCFMVWPALNDHGTDPNATRLCVCVRVCVCVCCCCCC